jgi:hypothetical protein
VNERGPVIPDYEGPDLPRGARTSLSATTEAVVWTAFGSIALAVGAVFTWAWFDQAPTSALVVGLGFSAFGLIFVRIGLRRIRRTIPRKANERDVR